MRVESVKDSRVGVLFADQLGGVIHQEPAAFESRAAIIACERKLGSEIRILLTAHQEAGTALGRHLGSSKMP